jgi:hypothetical protein
VGADVGGGRREGSTVGTPGSRNIIPLRVAGKTPSPHPPAGARNEKWPFGLFKTAMCPRSATTPPYRSLNLPYSNSTA